jgi:hypothetical protein
VARRSCRRAAGALAGLVLVVDLALLVIALEEMTVRKALSALSTATPMRAPRSVNGSTVGVDEPCLAPSVPTHHRQWDRDRYDAADRG